MVVGKAYSGSERLPLDSLGCGYGNRVPTRSGLSGGSELIALARNRRNLLGYLFLPNVFCRGLIRFGGHSRDGAEAETLLRGNSDCSSSGARDNLEKVQRVGAQIEKPLVHAYGVKVEHLAADCRELFLSRSAGRYELFLAWEGFQDQFCASV